MRPLRMVLTAVTIAAGATVVSGYALIGEQWPNGNVVVQEQLGASGVTLIDGSPDWDSTFEEALLLWNSYISRVKFTFVRGSTAPKADNNGLNNVFFSSTIFGRAFGSGTLAVTTEWFTGTRRLEGDIVFNTAFSWNSYRGPLRTMVGGGRVYDLRRVGLHEAGHLLGLDHPDQFGQSVSAIMNSVISDLDTLTADDIAGAQFLYGATTQPLPCTYAISPGSALFRSTGGSGVVTVTTQAGCTWTNASSSGFLHVTAGASGNGSGTTSYSVDSLGSGRRYGSLTIAGQTFFVAQGFLSTDDLDGDLKTDVAIFRPSDGLWYVRRSLNGFSTSNVDLYQWGLPDDTPLSGDFDGDGRTDLTVWRPSNGTWYIRYSSQGYSTATSQSFQWGLAGDVPISGDFDGDQKTELAVWRPSNGTWYIRYSLQGYSTATSQSFQWGLPGDVPLTGDFDGDGRTDLTVWRPSNGTWYIRYSSQGYSLATSQSFQWGLPGDIPVTGDFDGDGRTDITVFRPANGGWYLRYSLLGYAFASSGFYQWGLPGDVPMSVDFDGDGTSDLAVFRPSSAEWHIRTSSTGYSLVNNPYFQWGLPGDALIK